MLKRHAKKGFTLIEMLIVIVIIGILAAYLIPRISGAQGKARDVARKADLRQYSAALSSYMLDNRVYIETGGCVNEVLGVLKEKNYITSIDKDPGQAKVKGCEGYYYYSGSNTHYVLMAAVDERTSANRCSGDTVPELGKSLSSQGGYREGGCDSETSLDQARFVQTD